MSEKKKFTHLKMTLLLTSFLLFLLLSLCVFTLDKYLYQFQRTEWLSKIDNYDNFTLTMLPQNRCQKREIMEYENKKIIFDCIEQVYVHYGSITLFLEEALKKNYITIDSILSHTIKEDKNLYFYQNQKLNMKFYIRLTDNEILFQRT